MPLWSMRFSSTVVFKQVPSHSKRWHNTMFLPFLNYYTNDNTDFFLVYTLTNTCYEESFFNIFCNSKMSSQKTSTFALFSWANYVITIYVWPYMFNHSITEDCCNSVNTLICMTPLLEVTRKRVHDFPVMLDFSCHNY